jgi:S-DNA-T family DNA segregation ATPase FtsK/SpoIIIE
MSTTATSSRKLLPDLGLSPEKGDEIIALLLGAVVLLLTGSLLSYHPLDPSLLHQAPEDSGTHNLIGPLGAQISALAFSFLGLTCLLLPVLLGTVAWRRWRGGAAATGWARALGAVAALPALPALLQLLVGEIEWRGEPLQSGGVVGVVLRDVLTDTLAWPGAFVVLAAALAIGSSLTLQSTIAEALAAWRRVLGGLWDRLLLLRAQRSKRRHEEETRTRVQRQVINQRSAGTDGRLDLPLRGGASAAAEAPRPEPPMRVVEKKGDGHFAVRKVRPGAGDAGSIEPAGATLPRAAEPLRPPEPPAARQQPLAFKPGELEPAERPPVNLLRTDRDSSKHDEEDLLRRGEVIREAFEHFGIEGSVESISPGPVITVFEFQPAPGIKVSRIVNLQDDLALALKAESVRIDRVPGRSTLGIEVPNKERRVIRLGELLESEKFQRAPSVLTLALGVDIHGRPYFADLTTMPHLLVAGATGAGKSVGLQSMITSILYKASRDQVQFIFIDPKRIELGVYKDIPHLKAEVVVEPKKAANALRWAVGEMERRYRLLAEVHVRSIAYYNRAVGDPAERQRLRLGENENELSPEDFKPLPYYVIIIDELADLMMVSSAEVEASIARLAQMARAVGIHLIVATQRPSVDVLTGTIKANFPCRLSYATATRHDSRTILDQIGAEKLLGKGDALFIPPGTSRFARLHGGFVTEQETAALVRWLKRRGKPELDPEVLEDPEKSRGGGNDGGDADDALFDEAARLVVAERQASASFLQRRLRVGFSRAARLIDMMEADGLLGPPQGSKPREVLVKPDYFEEIDRARRDE